MSTGPLAPRAVTHCIFDLDGLLIETESLYTVVTQEIVGRHGKTFTPALKARMMGRKAIESAGILVEALSLPIAPEDYLRERGPRLLELFAGCEAMPGAERLVRHLDGAGVPLALATGSDAEALAAKQTRHRDWLDLLAVRVLGDDPALDRGKPDPQVFLETARRLGAEPAACLVFEDAPNGVEAGLAAGMAVVAVPGGHAHLAAYPAAHLVLDSLEDFDPAPWGLPPFP